MARPRKHDPGESALSERMTLVPTDHSGFPHERAHYDRFWRKAVFEVCMLDLIRSQWLDLAQTFP
jgi:hypothetical protein